MGPIPTMESSRLMTSTNQSYPLTYTNEQHSFLYYRLLSVAYLKSLFYLGLDILLNWINSSLKVKLIVFARKLICGTSGGVFWYMVVSSCLQSWMYGRISLL